MKFNVRRIIAFAALCAAVLLARTATAQEARTGDEASSHKVGTRLPVQQTAVLPVECVQISPGHLFIDFGRAAFAGLDLRFPQLDHDRKVTVRVGEKLSAPHAIDRQPGGSVRYYSAEIALTKGQENYRLPLRPQDGRLMPTAIGPVMPFRYVEIENAPASLSKEDIRQLAVHYPFDDQAADFRSSDEKLNAVWELSKYSMKATSFGGVFVDGDRERKPYEADAYINQLGWFYTAGDYTLPRYTHEYLMAHPTWPTEWILFSVLMAWDDYLYSGDATNLRKFYSELQVRTLIGLARNDGLISTPRGNLPKAIGRVIHEDKIRDVVDWPEGERDGYEMCPLNTVVNAFHARALDRMALIAAALGKREDESHFRAAATKVASAINEKLADPATGLYVDGEGSRHSSLHANMFPLAFGLVLPERRERVTSFVRSRGMACSVYGSQFLMDALWDAGEEEHAIALITAPGDRSWRHMIEDVGTTITLEAWDTKYKKNQDWNHAWGAAPANILPRKLLGVEPISPGWIRFQVDPHLGKLKWAEGRIPTPHGAILVRAEAADEFQLNVTVPAGATAVILIPAKAATAISESGRPLAAVRTAKVVRQSASRVTLEVPAGTYRFSAER